MLLIGIHVMDLLQDVVHPRMQGFAANPSSITGDELLIAALQEMQLEIHDELHMVRCVCLPVLQLAKHFCSRLVETLLMAYIGSIRLLRVMGQSARQTFFML